MKFLYKSLFFLGIFQITASEHVSTPSRPTSTATSQFNEGANGKLYPWLDKMCRERDLKGQNDSSFEEETVFNATKEIVPNSLGSKYEDLEISLLKKKFGDLDCVAPRKASSSDSAGKSKANKVIKFNLEIMFGRSAGRDFTDGLKEGKAKNSFIEFIKNTIKNYTKKDELENGHIHELCAMATTRNLKKEGFWNDSFEKYYAQLTKR